MLNAREWLDFATERVPQMQEDENEGRRAALVCRSRSLRASKILPNRRSAACSARACFIARAGSEPAGDREALKHLR